MSSKLSDEELAVVRCLVPAECVGLLASVDAMTAELHRLRALLSAPMPKGWSEPFVENPEEENVPGADGRVGRLPGSRHRHPQGPTMTTPPNREALRALCEKATPGPWKHDVRFRDEYDTDEGCWGDLDGPDNRSLFTVDMGDFNALSVDDAAFIAAARTAIPALLDELERVEAEANAANRIVRDDYNEMKELRVERDRLKAQLDSTLGPETRVLVDAVLDRADIERDTAERIAAFVEQRGSCRLSELAAMIRAGRYRPTSHAPREGGGDE